jgi:hypothetical protein
MYGGLSRLLSLQVQAIGSLERRQRLVDISDPPRRVTQRREVVGRELHVLAYGLEALPSGGPIVANICLSGGFENRGDIIHPGIQSRAKLA